jgi:hypothetical protein
MVASADLTRVRALAPPALLDPDVPIRTGRDRLTGMQQIAWSPDGLRIAYPRAEVVEREDGEPILIVGLWEVDAAGGAPHRLACPDTRNPQLLTTYRSVSWSATGARFAFVGRGDHGETAIYIRPARTNPHEDAPLPRFDSWLDSDLPTWSRDGRRLAFRQGIVRALTADPIERLRIIQPGGTDARDLWTLTPKAYAALTGLPEESLAPRIVDIAWAPGGSRIAATVAAGPENPPLRDLWVVSTRGAPAPKRLPGSWIGARWLDERRIGALRRTARGGFEADAIDTETAAVTRLTDAPSDDMDWSPQGRSIVCAIPNMEGPAANAMLRVLRTGI